MFLQSNAFSRLDADQLAQWTWEGKTILFVSHDWDPAHDGAEAIAGRRLAAALLDAGARLHVLAAAHASTELRHERYDLTTIPIRRPLSPNKFSRAFEMMTSTVPEAAGQWVHDAVQAGTTLLSSLPDDTLIYGRAMPGASNVVAWRLAQWSECPWVAHFSDEWPSVGVLSHGRGWLAPYKWPLYQFWRRRILRDAGALTFTNPLQGADIVSERPEYLLKSFTVTHLATSGRVCTEPADATEFHIVHSGNVYFGRTAKALMVGLRRFLDRTPAAQGRVRFTQVGWDAGDLPEWSARCALDGVVRCQGRTEPSEVVKMLERASLLVAIDFALPVSTTLPSKMPDYINARRPLLAMTAPGTSMWHLFVNDGAGLTAHYDDPEEVAGQIACVFEAWRRGRLDTLLPEGTAAASFDSRQVLNELAGAFLTARAAAGVAWNGQRLTANHRRVSA